MFHQFAHWFFHDLTPWVTGIAQAHPEWCFPIAFLVAFSDPFVGVSFIIPGTFLLITLGAVIGASHISVIPAWAGAVKGLGDGRLDLLLDRISLSPPDPAYLAVPQLRSPAGKRPAFLPHRRHLGDLPGPFPAVRATVPLVAGMSELEFWPFQIANTASAIIWAFALFDPCGRRRAPFHGHLSLDARFSESPGIWPFVTRNGIAPATQIKKPPFCAGTGRIAPSRWP